MEIRGLSFSDLLYLVDLVNRDIEKQDGGCSDREWVAITNVRAMLEKKIEEAR